MSAKLVCAVIFLAGAVASADNLGSVADIEEFPSLAQVEFKVDVLWVQQCLGSIITNYHILTLASCFSGPGGIPENRRVRVGASQRASGGEIVNVYNIYKNPNFGLLGHDADIAVVSLTSALTLGPTVQQAQILGEGIQLPFGLRVQNVGFGTTAEGGEESNDDLYKLDLYVNDSEKCLEQYIFDQDITENMVCVGLGYTQGRDFDLIDSGASLFYDNTLVGLLVYGKSADDEYPIVATNVGSYTAWIIETTYLPVTNV